MALRLVDNEWICELDNCVIELQDCLNCPHCIDGLYYALKDAEEMLRENPYYIYNGEVHKIDFDT